VDDKPAVVGNANFPDGRLFVRDAWPAGYSRKDEDAYRLSPLQHENINLRGRYFIFDAGGSGQKRIGSTA